MNKLKWAERRKIGRKREEDGQDVLESKAPGRISEGGKRKGPNHQDGKHRNLI